MCEESNIDASNNSPNLENSVLLLPGSDDDGVRKEDGGTKCDAGTECDGAG